MSGIVERLKAWEPLISAGYECPAAGQAMFEAAAEIERLTELVAMHARLAQQSNPLAGRCPHCDDTGDVHRADGEWMGTCACPAGQPNPLADEVERLRQERQWLIEAGREMEDKLWVLRCNSHDQRDRHAAETAVLMWRKTRAALKGASHG